MMGGRPRTRASSSLADKQQRQLDIQQTRSSVEHSSVHAAPNKPTGSVEPRRVPASNAGDSHVPDRGASSTSKNQPRVKKTPMVPSGRRSVAKNTNTTKSGKSRDRGQDHVTLSLKINRKKNNDAETSLSTTDGAGETQEADRTVADRVHSLSKDKHPVPVELSKPPKGETGKGSHDDGGEKKTAKLLSSSMTSSKDVTLPVTCGTNVGRLFLNRLETGSRGLCVNLSDGKWMTPNEFQAVSGRGNAKDWKRSIRHHDKSLKLLEKMGLLSLFSPPICLCEHCDVQPKHSTTTTNSSRDEEQLVADIVGSKSASLVADQNGTAVVDTEKRTRKIRSSSKQNISTVSDISAELIHSNKSTVFETVPDNSENRHDNGLVGKNKTGSGRQQVDEEAAVNFDSSKSANSCADKHETGLTSCVLVKRTSDGWKAETKFGRSRDGDVTTGKDKESIVGSTKETPAKTILNVPTFVKLSPDGHVVSPNSATCSYERNSGPEVGVLDASFGSRDKRSVMNHKHSGDETSFGDDSKPSTRLKTSSPMLVTSAESTKTISQSATDIASLDSNDSVTQDKVPDRKQLSLSSTNVQVAPPLPVNQLCISPSSSTLLFPASVAKAAAPSVAKSEADVQDHQCQLQQQPLHPRVQCPSVILTTRQPLTEQTATPGGEGKKPSDNLLLGPSTPAAVYSVSPPYLVMGITLHRLACLSQQSATPSSVVGQQQQRGNRKRKHQNNDQRGVETKRHRRTGSRNRRHVAVDDVSSTTPDCSLQSDNTVNGTSSQSTDTVGEPRSSLPHPVDTSASAMRQVMDGRQSLSHQTSTKIGNGGWNTGYGTIIDASVIKREELIFDRHGALDLSVKKCLLPRVSMSHS